MLSCSTTPRSETREENGVLWVPMSVGDAPAVVVHVRDGAGHAKPLKCLIDTGNTCGLVVTTAVASQLGLTLPARPEAYLNTNSGMIPAYTGNTSVLEIGGLAHSLDIDVIEKGPNAILGQQWLRRNAGLIFDWPRKRMGLVPADVELPTGEGWVELALIEVSFEPPGDELPPTIRPNRLLVHSSLAGQRAICHLDTGFPGDLSTNGRIRSSGCTRSIRVGTFGRSYRAVIGEAPEPLEIGSLAFSNLNLLILPPRENALDLHSFSAGLGVLTRHPMWVDYDRSVVRFWLGKAAPFALPLRDTHEPMRQPQ